MSPIWHKRALPSGLLQWVGAGARGACVPLGRAGGAGPRRRAPAGRLKKGKERERALRGLQGCWKSAVCGHAVAGEGNEPRGRRTQPHSARSTVAFFLVLSVSSSSGVCCGVLFWENSLSPCAPRALISTPIAGPSCRSSVCSFRVGGCGACVRFSGEGKPDGYPSASPGTPARLPSANRRDPQRVRRRADQSGRP